VGSFCIRPVYMGCAPCAFNNIELLPIKKKKKICMKGTSSPLSKSLVASSSNMVVAVNGEESSLNGLTHSQRL
jgi:hypothetical protein